VPEPPTETDEEVLRELGAFDEVDSQEKDTETSSSDKVDTIDRVEDDDTLPPGKLPTTSRFVR
jgi:hypothetical protein